MSIMFKTQQTWMCLSIMIISLFLSPHQAISQVVSTEKSSKQFPFLAEVIDQGINVRAGQNTGFEKLCQMEKGDEVIVYEESFNWYKIRLPQRCPAYIIEKYVERIDNIKGKIIGSHVNIRAAAKAESSSIGMIAKDEEIKILSKKEGWYKVVPDAHTFGWIAGQFVSFKSNDIALYHEPSVPVDFPTEKDATIAILDASLPEGVLNITGTLEHSNILNKEGIGYQITMNGEVKYYLKSNQDILERFVGMPVNVKGVQIQSLANISVPVLDLYQIRLVY
jgi:hypothetical protein